MKKASKLLHIFAGIIGIFVTLALAVICVYYFLCIPAGIVLLILYFTGIVGGESALVSGIIYPIFGLLGLIPSLLFVLSSFIGTVLAFVGIKNNKVINIINIVFGVFAIGPFLFNLLFAVLFALYFIILILLILLIMLTPYGWIGLSFIIGSFGSLLFMILSILSGVFGLLASRKKKEPLPEPEVVEEEVIK